MASRASTQECFHLLPWDTETSCPELVTTSLPGITTVHGSRWIPDKPACARATLGGARGHPQALPLSPSLMGETEWDIMTRRGDPCQGQEYPKHPGSAEESRCVLNPEAVFPPEWSREMALLPQRTWNQGPKERGQEGQVAGAGEELEGRAAMRVSGRAFLVLCLPQAHRDSHPQGTRRAPPAPGIWCHPFLRPPDPSGIPLGGTSSHLLCCGWLRPRSSSPRAETDLSNLCPAPAVRAPTRVGAG